MNTKTKVFALVTFLAMVTVNALASILPINGISTAQISDKYANLFAPAGLTFSIWGLIYLLLAGYILYLLIAMDKNTQNRRLFNKVGILFSISSVANALWIFSWHYDFIFVSMVLMTVILVCLILIVNSLKKESLSTKEKIFVKLPFSIYFGWITVATIANATTLLVSLGWNGFGISEAIWTVIIVSIGAVIGILTVLKNKDYAYGLVILWAYAGILIKHMSTGGFNGIYIEVIISVIVCLVLTAGAEVYAIAEKAY